MNNTINKLLLAGDKFMPEMHLRQPQFTYSACGPFTKHKQRIQKFKETGDTNYIYKNELGKACFVHDAAYSDSKDVIKRTVADKILKNKAFDIAKDPKYDGYQRGLASMVYKFFDKKSVGSGAKHVNTKLIPQNKQLAEELHKPIIRKFEKRKVHAAFKDNIWGADLVDMQLLSKYNKGIRFLLRGIDDKEISNKDPKFKVGDRVRISKYKNIFAKGYMPNWSEEVFVIKKVKNTVPWTYVINDLNGEEIIGTFYEKELQRQIKKNSELKK